MRAKLLGAVLAVLFAPLALAADVDRAGKIAAPVIARADDDGVKWNRTGAYVVGIVGYDVLKTDIEGLNFADGQIIGGGAVGYNWRLQGFVLGLEADWIFTGISASLGDEVLLKASTEHLVTVRARAGLPAGPALLYLTAGPAWQQAKLTVGADSDRTWQLGGAFGGGIEVELTRSMFVGVEALHYIFPNDGAPLSDLFDSENQHTTVRARIGFKLN